MNISSNQVGGVNGQRAVLLGSAGTGTAFAAACALRRVWSQSVKIVAMDINPRNQVTTSLLADHFEQVPLSASSVFQDRLIEIIQRYAVDTYLPLFPEEIMLASRLRENGFLSKKIDIMAPSLAASAACADKWSLANLLSQHDVAVPKTALATEPFRADEFFLKPKNGTGSRGARKIKADELSGIVGICGADWVVQENCNLPEVTVDVFHDSESGFDRVICRERLEIKAGVSTKCRLFEDETLSRYARSIAEVLKLEGSFCFQTMQNAKGWVVTDVNPRPGAATSMCAATGNDFFAASFALCWGEDPRQFFRPLNGEQYVTRQYSEFLMAQ
jgi:carbamoylphosphate synthase large subunit